MASQRVVIPKGLVNPNETTIIEIPQLLQHVPAVVAVRRGDASGSYYGGCPGAQQEYMPEYGDYSNVTIPDFPSYPLIADVKGETINEIRPRRDLMDFSDKAVSIGGQGLDDPSGMSKAKFEDWVQKNTSWRLETLEDDIIDYNGFLEHPLDSCFRPIWGLFGKSVAREPHCNLIDLLVFSESNTIVINSLGPREESIDYSDPELRKGGFDPYVHTHQLMKFASPYKQFQPCQYSTPTSYVPSGERAMGWRNMSKPQELSYLRAQSPTGPVGGQQLKTMPGELDNTDSATEAGIRDVLEKMEYIELSKIQQDLRDFQVARRKLIFDATNMAPPKLGGGQDSRIPRYAKTYKR